MFEKKTMIEQLRTARRNAGIAYVYFYNNGDIEKKTSKAAKSMNRDYNVEYPSILDMLKDATSSYLLNTDFDTIKMGLLIGVIYDKAYVDDNDKIIENATPINDIVHYYTYIFDTFKDGERNSPYSYYKVHAGSQGYIKYSEFIKYLENEGLDLEGPKTFEELNARIASGEVFDINIVADLQFKNEKYAKLLRKK